MKRILFCLIAVCATGLCNAQSDTTVKDTADFPFTKYAIEAYFPGGTKAWEKFIEKNLNSDEVIKKAVGKKAKHWQQTAYVRFLVEVDGSIKDITVTNADKLHKEVVKESFRIISISPKWNPGIQNGKKLRSYHTEEIIFRKESSLQMLSDIPPDLVGTMFNKQLSDGFHLRNV